MQMLQPDCLRDRTISAIGAVAGRLRNGNIFFFFNFLNFFIFFLFFKVFKEQVILVQMDN